MASHRRPVYFNPSARNWSASPDDAESMKEANEFHRRLSNYKPTPLVQLNHLAQELGVGAVYVKDETNRFGLPAFKFLGASWGTFRAICQELQLPVFMDLYMLKKNLSARSFCLFAATAGNHGRGVARMGAMLAVPVQIHMPSGAHPKTVALIESQGAKVVISNGDYDLAMLEALAAARKHEFGILIQDSVVEGHSNQVLKWITQGYSTMFLEIDDQLAGKRPDMIVCPVGVGSLAQAAVTHYKHPNSQTLTMMVGADTAPTLWKSLQNGRLTQVPTTRTIMAGIECATLSTLAWPLLKEGVDASLTISDYEAHSATLDLQSSGIPAGPCGGASLAALRRLNAEDKAKLGLNEKSIVILLCTEATRDYDPPRDVSIDDADALVQMLEEIRSSSSSPDVGAEEAATAHYIMSWMHHRNIDCSQLEQMKLPGKINASIQNQGIESITPGGYDDEPRNGKFKGESMCDRDTTNTKSDIAAMLIAMANVAVSVSK